MEKRNILFVMSSLRMVELREASKLITVAGL